MEGETFGKIHGSQPADFPEKATLSEIPVNSNPDSAAGRNTADLPRNRPFRFALAAVVSGIYWTLGGVVIMLIALVSGLFLDVHAHRMFGQKVLGVSLGQFITILEWLGIIRVEDSELRKHQEMPGPLIIACNHPALWDALLVVRRFKSLSCIMKADVQLNPLLRTGARFAGFLPNAPQIKLVKKSVERLNQGGRLLLFPEGTRTRSENGVLNPLRPGLALMARESGAPVLPIFIRTDSRYLEKGWPLLRMPPVPISISLHPGPILEIGEREKVRDFSARLEGVFREELGGIRKKPC